MNKSLISVYTCHLCKRIYPNTYITLRQCFDCANYICENCIKQYVKVEDKDEIMQLYKDQYLWPENVEWKEYDFKINNCPKLLCFDCHIKKFNPERWIDNKDHSYKFSDIVDLSMYSNKVAGVVESLLKISLVDFDLNRHIKIIFQPQPGVRSNENKYNVYKQCSLITDKNIYYKVGAWKIYEYDKLKSSITFYDFCALIMLFNEYSLTFEFDINEIEGIQSYYDTLSTWDKIKNEINRHNVPEFTGKELDGYTFNRIIDEDDLFIWRYNSYNWMDIMINGDLKFYYMSCTGY